MKTNSGKKSATKADENALQGLAKEIRGHLAKFDKSIRSSLGFARQAGEALIKAKELLPKGKSWQQWVGDNCQIDIRQAQKYITISRKWGELVQQGHDPDQLSINEAVRLLASPRTKAVSSPKEKAKAEAHGSAPFRLSAAELAVKKQEARRFLGSAQIRFTDETPEGKLLQETLKAVAEKLRRAVTKLVAAHGNNGQVQEAHYLIALTEKLSLDLQPELVFEVAGADAGNVSVPAAAAQDASAPPAAKMTSQTPSSGQDEPTLPVEPRNRVSDVHKGNGLTAQVA